jgi:hypothetical protein
LISWLDQAILPSSGRSHGECGFIPAFRDTYDLHSSSGFFFLSAIWTTRPITNIRERVTPSRSLK